MSPTSYQAAPPRARASQYSAPRLFRISPDVLGSRRQARSRLVMQRTGQLGWNPRDGRCPGVKFCFIRRRQTSFIRAARWLPPCQPERSRCRTPHAPSPAPPCWRHPPRIGPCRMTIAQPRPGRPARSRGLGTCASSHGGPTPTTLRPAAPLIGAAIALTTSPLPRCARRPCTARPPPRFPKEIHP